MERIFNLYLFIQSGITLSGVIHKLGVATHERNGTEADKIIFLQEHAGEDLARAKRFPLLERYALVGSATTQIGLDYRGYGRLVQMGRYLEVFEEVFQTMRSPGDPLVCITPVVDGNVQIEGTQQL